MSAHINAYIDNNKKDTLYISIYLLFLIFLIALIGLSFLQAPFFFKLKNLV